MEKDYNEIITNVYKNVSELYKKTNEKMFQFITKASEFVDLSENLYQIERTIKLNKISIKAYILDSDCCKSLVKNNISNYSIDDLKEYLKKYELETKENCEIYTMAINIYEILEQIESLVDERIELEVEEISNLTETIIEMKNATNENYENIYMQVKNQLTFNYLNKNLINNNTYEMCIFMINDIFNYYISGYPNIPDDVFDKKY